MGTLPSDVFGNLRFKARTLRRRLCGVARRTLYPLFPKKGKSIAGCFRPWTEKRPCSKSRRQPQSDSPRCFRAGKTRCIVPRSLRDNFHVNGQQTMHARAITEISPQISSTRESDPQPEWLALLE